MGDDVTYDDRRDHERRHRERHSARMKRVRETIDTALADFDFEPSYLLSDGDYLHPHVECSRCRAVIKATGMAPFDHWATHHRLRAGFLRSWRRILAREHAKATGDHQPMSATVDVSTADAKPVHSERPSDERNP